MRSPNNSKHGSGCFPAKHNPAWHRHNSSHMLQLDRRNRLQSANHMWPAAIPDIGIPDRLDLVHLLGLFNPQGVSKS